MPRVFVTHVGNGMDFSKAERFGELVYLAQHKINILHPTTVAGTMAAGLEDFHEEDFLCLAGNVLAVFFAGLYLPDTVKRLQLLVWDQREQDYMVRTVSVP